MGAGNSRQQRTLASYLALPRPGDINKALIVPLTFALGAAAVGVPSAAHLLRAVIIWFAVEYLAYQARYQWNDIRGFWSDQAHPDCAQRGRLPGPAERGRRHIAMSWLVVAVRVIAALSLVILLPALDLGPVLVPAVVAVFAVAAVYESVRSRAASCASVERPHGAAVALWFVSGAGYCLRGLIGLTLAVGPGAGAATLVAAGAACWTTGIVFVMTRWAVETIPFASREGDRLVWRATSGQRRGHLLPLAGWIPQRRTPPTDLRSWRPLAARCDWHAPWNIALAPALAFAFVAGASLSSISFSPAGCAAATVVLALVWTALVCRTGALTAAGSVALLALLGAAVGDVMAGLPAAVVAVLYVLCTHQSLVEIGMSLPARTRARVAGFGRFMHLGAARGREPMPPRRRARQLQLSELSGR